MVFNNWGRINDNHAGHIFVGTTDAGASIDLYCCYKAHRQSQSQ